MKVILQDEVRGKGHEGDVVNVARGFAVNYLFPKELAIEATAGNLKQLEARRSNIEKRETKRRSADEGIAAALDGKAVTIEAKAGEEGRLFGSVTSQMIQDAVLDQLEMDVDRKKLDIGAHIKEIGDHEVTIKVSHDVKATIAVRVILEGGEVEHKTSFLEDAEKAEAEADAALFEADAAIPEEDELVIDEALPVDASEHAAASEAETADELAEETVEESAEETTPEEAPKADPDEE